MNAELRSLFPVTEQMVYLNHAAVAPPPTPTIQAVESQLRDVCENGSLNYRSWLEVKREARQLLSTLLGARPEQVAFTRNTSDGLSTVANGLRWAPGDNLVTFRREFPSNLYPWLRIGEAFGVEVRFCEERNCRMEASDLIGLMDHRTRLVAISHVQYASGFRVDLERLGRAARSHDALLVVDVIQSLGAQPLDVEAELVDVAAAAGHKWLLTPEGIGILYLSDRARERIEPTLVGWTSVPAPEDYDNQEQGWNTGTLAWETGTAPTALFYGLRSSLSLLASVGIPRIATYLEELTDYLCAQVKGSGYEVVSPRNPGEKSQIVSLRHQAGVSPLSLYSRLRAQNILTAPRGGGLRIAPHFYNTVEDIDQLVRTLP